MSAHTMRLLVKLAKEKRRKEEQHALSPNTQNKKNIRRGKTLTNVEATPEETVARRISHLAAERSPPPNEASTKPLRPTHIRSYSEPKDTIEDITNMNLDAEDTKDEASDLKKGHVHNNTDSLSRDSDDGNSAVPSEDDSANNHNAMPSVGSQSVSATNDSFASRTQSHTHTLSGSHSNTQSSYLPSIKNKFHGKGGKQEMSLPSMSHTTTYTQSQASTTVTVTDVSRNSNISNISNTSDGGGANTLGSKAPALDTVSESGQSMKFEDLNDILSKTHSARHAKDKQGSNNTSVDTAQANANDGNGAPPSVYVASDSEDTNSTKGGGRGHSAGPSLEKVEENQQLNTNPPSEEEDNNAQSNNNNNNNGNNSNSIFSMLFCCCSSNQNNSNTNNRNNDGSTRLASASAYGQKESQRAQSNSHTIQPLAASTTSSIELNDKKGNNRDSNNSNISSVHTAGAASASDQSILNTFVSNSLQLDQLTATTATQLRRPTQFSTQTKNEDQTIEPSDVHLWDEPFGKGASGRVFKAVYLPLCQVLAVKVVNRLDNENVKQVLGEFRDQQELLPDCDRLMRIWGWYRDLDKNTVVIALEYMDMGSIYDSCFPKDRYKAGDNLLNSTAEEQEKSGHKQVTVDKLTYDQLRFIAREALVGLHALHTCDPPLVHRDIKPQNILASSLGEVKIADFGLLARVNRQTLRLNDQKGTEKYFSPERINKDYSTGSDIWALGITMIEIYNQELIPSDQLEWFKLVDEGIDINDFMPATAPTEFVSFLKKCLCKDESKRPSAKELLADKFVSRGWGNALDSQPNFSRKKLVQFADIKPDQKTLDKLLGWLETWILEDENQNAKLFSEGDPEHLKQCVQNLAKFTGNTPEYIDRYIAEVYREHLNTHKKPT